MKKLSVNLIRNIIALVFIFFSSLTFAGGQSMNNAQLVLEVDGLEVYLVNQGDDYVIAMPNGRSLPLLTMNLNDSDGNKLAIKNRADLMKFDNSLHNSDFIELAAGTRLKIGEAVLQHNQLDLDLFTVNLLAGAYQLSFIYSNNRNQYYDTEVQRLISVDNVWVGEIESQRQGLIVK